jgi:nicotinamide mononucleotide transporter
MHWATIVDYLVANWMENVGAFTSVVGIWLTTRRNLFCWPMVLVSDVLYLTVFYRVQLYSDSLLQLFFLIFTLYGWWYWSRGVREEGEVRIARLTLPGMLAGLFAGGVGSVLLGFVMTRIGAALPRLDATLMSYSLVATWWQTRKHIASWWLWIAVDLIYIGEYVYKGLKPTAALYVLLVVLAMLGLRNWRRTLQISEAEDENSSACRT